MLNRLLLAFAALVMLPCAAMAETLEGTWALRIDGTTIFRFDLQQAGDGSWQGQWTRPREFRHNGVIFSEMEGRYEAMSRSGQAQGDAVRLTFDDPRPRSLPETVRFRVTGEGTAQFTFVDTGAAPLPLVRVAQDSDIGPFAEGRLYDRDNAQIEPTLRAAPARASRAPVPQPEPPLRAAQPDQELPALATPAPAPAPRSQPVEELPALTTPAPAPRVQAEVQPRRPAPATASSVMQGEAWQPDPSVSAAIAARAAALEGASAPAADQPIAEPGLPAAASAAPQTGTWQPDPSVRAAIAQRAAELEGSTETVEEAEAAPAKPESGLGADFLEGL